MVALLGNDKNEVIDFLVNTDNSTFEAMNEIYEELALKFGKSVDDIFCNPDKHRNFKDNSK